MLDYVPCLFSVSNIALASSSIVMFFSILHFSEIFWLHGLAGFSETKQNFVFCLPFDACLERRYTVPFIFALVLASGLLFFSTFEICAS